MTKPTGGLSARIGHLLTVLRFAAVGLVATGVYLGAALCLVWVGVTVELSHIVAFVISIIASYAGHKVYTFQNRDSLFRTGPRFLLASGIIAALQTALVFALSFFGIHPMLILIMSTVFYPACSFLAHTFWTFRYGTRAS